MPVQLQITARVSANQRLVRREIGLETEGPLAQ